MKKTIAGRIIESVIGFDKWAEENKKKFLEKYKDERPWCVYCGDEGVVEILGDGENFECDVLGYKKCPHCLED